MIRVFSSNVGTEELSYVSESVKQQWLGAGPKLKLFEERMAKELNSPFFLMLNNCTNSLYIACKLLDLPSGSEIILPSFTWVGCAHAIKLAGLTPVFCDVDLVTQNITAKTIKPRLSQKTKAIMIVHYAGLPVDLLPIVELGYPIIEDSAHAVCSIYKGQRCGTIGTMGAFSFDSMKNIAIGEGGGLVFQNKELFERAKRIRLCGLGKSSYESLGEKKRWWESDTSEPSLNYIPSDIAAGFGLGQLDKLYQLQTRRKEIWKNYSNSLSSIKEIQLPVDVNSINDKHSYFTYCIRLTDRDKLAQYLIDNSVYTTLRFFPIHLNTYYASNLNLPNTELLNETALNIPLHPNLTNNEQDKVIELIKKFFFKKN